MYNQFNLRHSVLSFVLFACVLLGSSIEVKARSRIILSGSKSITSQISTSDKGALYIVQEEINLRNKTVKLPQEAILQFEGGCFTNGGLIGNNTTIVAGRYEILKAVSLSGPWILDGIPAEWFGAVPNNAQKDCADSINKAIEAGIMVNAPVLLGSGIYYTKSTINIPDKGAVIGLGAMQTTICFSPSSQIGVFVYGQYPTLRNIGVREDNMGRTGICIKVGDSKTKVSCTRGFIEDVKVMGGDRGLDLEYLWCNKITGVNSRYNNIGLYANGTTPYVENAVIEANYEYGVFSEGSGIKLYNAIIEANKIGCVLNGRENLLNNCYFEGNSASLLDKQASKDRNGVDIEGGHLYVGEQVNVGHLLMISCLFGDAKNYNNTIRIDKCQGLTAIGCNSLKNLKITRNCIVKSIDDSSYKTE